VQVTQGSPFFPQCAWTIPPQQPEPGQLPSTQPQQAPALQRPELPPPVVHAVPSAAGAVPQTPLQVATWQVPAMQPMQVPPPEPQWAGLLT
jgi:hypothetical protein